MTRTRCRRTWLASPRQVVAATVVAALLGAAGCDADAEEDSAGAPAPGSGGTLRVVLSGWPALLDPQLITSATEANISKLVTRTLTTFRPEPGDAASELVPDLATDTGRPNADHTIWDFTLRAGVQWQDGEPVSCRDLKYGVQRRYSRDEDRQTGSTVPLRYLRDNDEPYQGPWVDAEEPGLASVECVDQQHIRYHLDKPVADFNAAVSLPVFAPVRPGADDDREGYNRAPLATGPYLVAEHEVDSGDPADNRLVLERNPHWNPATDPHREAYPDRIVVSRTDEVAATTNDLLADRGADRNRILLDRDIAATFRQQVMTDPDLAERVASGPMGAVRYLPVNTALIPEVPCRQALAYAVNKRKLRSVLGGELVGELATGMIPPNLPAHLEFDHFGTGEFPDGQPERAVQVRREAEAAGTECPDEVSLAYPDTTELERMAGTVVESYQRIEVHVTPVPIPPDEYFTADGVLGDQGWELTWIGLSPAWPNGSAVIPGLFDGRTSEPGSASHLNRLDDDRIHQMIDTAFAEADQGEQNRLWGEIDSTLVEMAVTIPLLYSNALRMHGSNVQGAFIHPQFGMPDLSAVGLADPTLASDSEDEQLS